MKKYFPLLKKYFPLLILLLGVFVMVVVFVLIRGKNSEEVISEDGPAPEIALEDRPVASLTPSEDGHWLRLNIDKIVIKNAESMDYELLYKLGDGRTQGVPGSLKLEGQESIERDLLMGSESSGKFRYDEGVEAGTLTLRFRNEKGKLIGKFSTDFHLQSDTKDLSSVDEVFTYTLGKSSTAFFVTMETFGYPDSPDGELTSDIYGVFTSSGDLMPGVVKINGAGGYYRWADKKIDSKTVNSSGEMRDVGIFSGQANTPEG